MTDLLVDDGNILRIIYAEHVAEFLLVKGVFLKNSDCEKMQPTLKAFGMVWLFVSGSYASAEPSGDARPKLARIEQRVLVEPAHPLRELVEVRREEALQEVGDVLEALHVREERPVREVRPVDGAGDVQRPEGVEEGVRRALNLCLRGPDLRVRVLALGFEDLDAHGPPFVLSQRNRSNCLTT